MINIEELKNTSVEEIQTSPYRDAIIALMQQKTNAIYEKLNNLEKQEERNKNELESLNTKLEEPLKQNQNRTISMQDFDALDQKHIDTLTKINIEKKRAKKEKDEYKSLKRRINCLAWLSNMPHGVDSFVFTRQDGKKMEVKKDDIYRDFIKEIVDATLLSLINQRDILRLPLQAKRKNKRPTEQEKQEMDEMNYRIFLLGENIENLENLKSMMEQKDFNFAEFFHYDNLTIRDFLETDCETIYEKISTSRTEEKEEERKIG